MSSERSRERGAEGSDPERPDPLDGWLERPELRPLLRRLVAGGHPEALAAAESEAAVARRLIERKVPLRVEIETPEGRNCDFEIAGDDVVAYLHVKRLRPNGDARALRISPRLASLERIGRPYVVSVWWGDGASDPAMRRLVGRAARFIRDAKVGDEMRVRDDAGREIGGCRILAPGEGRHVSLVIGLPHGFHDRAPRVQRLLRKAHQQFMPGAANVVLISGTDPADALAVEEALLGTHVERWDRFPPRGTRIAHGRADDGFWHGRQYADSRIAGWFRLADDGSMADLRLWYRDADAENAPVAELLRRAL